MKDHLDAAVALLQANPYLTVFTGPPEPGIYRTPPYVTVYLYVASDARTKLQGPVDETHIVLITHSVGANEEACDIVGGNVRGKFLDARLAVPGWLCTRFEHTGRPWTWNQTTGTTVADQVDEWSYRAQPA